MSWFDIQKIWEFGSTEDKIFMIIKIIGAVLIAISIFTIAINSIKMKKNMNRIENELKTVNRHLAHLDPNKYPESRDIDYRE